MGRHKGLLIAVHTKGTDMENESTDSIKQRYGNEHINLPTDNWRITITTEAEDGFVYKEGLYAATLNGVRVMLKDRLAYFTRQWLQVTFSRPQMPTCRFCDMNAAVIADRIPYCTPHAIQAGVTEFVSVWSS
jgi:hypothetical protein